MTDLGEFSTGSKVVSTLTKMPGTFLDALQTKILPWFDLFEISAKTESGLRLVNLLFFFHLLIPLAFSKEQDNGYAKNNRD